MKRYDDWDDMILLFIIACVCIPAMYYAGTVIASMW